MLAACNSHYNPNIHKYIMYSTQYILGPTKQEKETGIQGLQELATTADNVSIRTASRTTLKTRWLAAYR